MNTLLSTLSTKDLDEMYCKRDYANLIKTLYPNYKKHGIRPGKNWSSDWHSYKLLCSSLFLEGCYYDCLIMMKELFSGERFDSDALTPRERAHFVECALESLLYCVFNGAPWDIDVREALETALEKAPQYYKACNEYSDEKYYHIKELYAKFLAGTLPYYTVTFFVPLVLNFDSYTFNLSDAPPYQSMTVKQEKRGSVNGMLFSTTINGFIKADSFWEGPLWEERQKLAVATLPVNMINHLLLIIAEGDTQDFMPRIRPEQLSSIVIHQYMGDGKTYHWCDGTMFDGQFIKKWAQRTEYGQETLERINQILIQNYNLPLYATLYHQAQNVMNVGLYEESIMLFFACIEATVHYWCAHLSELHGVSTEYAEFETKKHVCRNCSLYQEKPTAQGVSSSEMPPSIRSYPGFLKKQKIINADQEKMLRKFIVEAQNENLRNKMMHGEVGRVSLAQVENCRKTIYKINEIFISVADGHKK